MRNTTRILGVAGAVAAVACAAATPALATGLKYRFAFTTARPAAPTGLSTRIAYPDGPSGKPKAVRSLRIELPAGSRFDPSVVPTCTASDAELALSIDSCPPDSRLGGGTGTVVTGFGAPIDPIAGDVHLYHGSGEIIAAGTPPESRSALTVSRLEIDGNTLTDPSIPPAPGGPPDGETVAEQVDIAVAPHVTGEGDKQRAFLSSPPICPARLTWTSRISATFSDGSTDSAISHAPCIRPSMRLSISPRRARATRRTTFRFKVSSSSARCERGALIRFGGANVRTDLDGRARVSRSFVRTGLRRARVVHKGCRADRAGVRVLPAARH